MRLGIPRSVRGKLRKALTKELQQMGSTYAEIAEATNPPLSPEQVLKLAKTWNGLTPEQHAAWEAAAEEENQRAAYGPSRN
jgi:hypothetical protein